MRHLKRNFDFAIEHPLGRKQMERNRLDTADARVKAFINTLLKTVGDEITEKS